jgi:lysophospholipase L1-like esterase
VRRLPFLTLVLVVFALAAPPASAAPGDSYVALGDSFAAGPLIPNQLLENAGCLRSDRNYAHLLAPALTSTPVLRDATCSGAQTRDMTAAQDVFPAPNPPQFDRLSVSTKTVTLQIGGNDIGFTGIVQNCATANPFGSPCRDQYVRNGQDEIANRINATAPKVAAVIDGIRARAPQARVFVLGYPTILPDSGIGCWPVIPIAWSDVSYLRAKHKQLNAMIASQATAHGARYVDVYGPSIGRDACKSSSVRWVEPVVPASAAAPLHPNLRGMQGINSVLRPIVGS